MSTAVFKRLPIAASKLGVFEKVKIYRDAAGAAPRALEPAVVAKPLNKALEAAVQDVTFLETDTLRPQPVDLSLTNKSRDPSSRPPPPESLPCRHRPAVPGCLRQV